MSIRMIPGAARLTVLGSGWSETALESGDAFTEDGELLDKVADDFGFDIGDDVDWDLIADDSDIDWDDIIYTDSEGNIYDDFDGDGIWIDANGNEYPGGGTQWVPEDLYLDLYDKINGLAQDDAQLIQYSIDRSALKNLWGGPVSQEKNVVSSGSDRPHQFSPPVFYIQTASNNAYLFQSEPFQHYGATGGNLTVYDEAITIRDGSTKKVYWSSCTTRFWDNFLPSQYASIPIQYVCWQCLYGPLGDALIAKTDNTATREDIVSGNTGVPSMVIGGVPYFAVCAKD